MRRMFVLVVVCLVATNAFAGTGRIVIVNSDGPNVGFNDPTPAAPVGGNSGTTLGQQRLNVFLAAAEKWQNAIDTDVDIRVRANFAPIVGQCDAEEGVLGAAGPVDWRQNFAGAPQANVWYPLALANKLANQDLAPSLDDIQAQFNADVDNPTCLGATKWYYGFDGNHGGDIDLFVVVLHEIAHGLGVSGARGTPNFRDNRPSVFDTHTFDVIAGLRWDQMSIQQRNISFLNTGNLVWDGENVRNAAGRFLQPVTMLAVTAPAAVARNYDIGVAAFGPPVSTSTASGTVAMVADEATSDGPATTDGCTALTNAAAVAGRIALVDRGSCTFATKARNAQAAGALALIVADNTRETCSPPGMGGDATDITIPLMSISQSDGDALKAQISANATVQAAVRIDPSQLAGTTSQGFVRLYAPCTFQEGSSTHHWDITASPNLLMEPFVASDLLHGIDLTLNQLLDMGWSLPPRTGRRILKK